MNTLRTLTVIILKNHYVKVYVLDRETVLYIARKSIKEIIVNKRNWLPDLKQEWMKPKRGVFTTVYKLNEAKKELRGCIGLPYPTNEVGHAIAISARKSVSEDPRFQPVDKIELNEIKISVEILSKMEKLTYKNRDHLKKQISLGKDGLLLKYHDFSGLLLPKVPVDYQMDKDDYLDAITRKAGLYPNILKKKENIELFKFSSQHFSE